LLLLTESVQLLLLVRLESALLLVLVGGELRQVAALLLLQTLAVLRLMTAEGLPILFPPILVQIVVVELGCLSAWAWRSPRRVGLSM
jgi:hypothetical protein